MRRIMATAMALLAGAALSLLMALAVAEDSPPEAGAGGPGAAKRPAPAAAPPERPPPATPLPATRNVVLLIGDGLGLGGISTASIAIHGPGGGLAVERAPVLGLVRTSAVNALVTDSAAAATALSTGQKTDRNRLGTAPDGRRLRHLLEAAQAAGMATGVVTSTAVMDATPAGFVAHAEGRDQRLELLVQMLRSGCDVLGGGHLGLIDEPPVRSALAAARAKGRSILLGRDELERVDGPFYALFPPAKKGAPNPRPPMKALVGKALEVLSSAAGPGGFVLVAEVEDTDVAGHRNDAKVLIEGVRQLDVVLRATLAFAERHPGTLVLVTADHETGGPAVTAGRPGAKGLKIRWLGTSHTATWVPLFAFGPGAGRFGGVLDNTEVPLRLAELLGLEGLLSPPPTRHR